MALGGGSFVTQNKLIPGSYINFVSAAKASAVLADRGTVVLPLSLKWGKAGFTEVTAGEFLSDCREKFGYGYTDEEMKPLREVFKNAKKAYIYRLGGGTKAANTYAEALYPGTRGNDISIRIEAGQSDYTVSVLLGSAVVDRQTVTAASGLKDNAFVKWKSGVSLTAGTTALTGGTDTAATEDNYQAFLDKSEEISFSIMVCPSAVSGIKSLFAAHTKNMRDNCGVKFQTVMYNAEENYEGIINVASTVKDSGADAFSLVYWTAGAEAGCEINRSITNKAYDGEFEINTAYKQSDLENGIKAGKLVFHRVGDSVRVLSDINSLTGFSQDKGKDFASNQVIRVLDQTGNDIAVLFNTKYLGRVQNNNAGRISFWNDIVTYNRKLEELMAIENFDSSDVEVMAGDDKTSVVISNKITPATAMEKLYMTVIVQ